MTAVVGILNKQAVAIAADSAVTIGNDWSRKILNRANKIFTLSKHHPVGVMLYNSAFFMGVPWEVAIKMYRQKLKDKAFATVEEYQNDFIKFLKKQPYFTNSSSQKRSLAQFCHTLLDMINNRVLKDPDFLRCPPRERVDRFLQKLEDYLDQFVDNQQRASKVCPELEHYTLEMFSGRLEEQLSAILEHLYRHKGIPVSEALKNKILMFLYLAFKSSDIDAGATGLVFAGYGNSEIFPTLNCLNVSFSIGKELRYHQQASFSVSDEQPSAIFPFAQTDVIDTILTGSDPHLWRTFMGNFDQFIRKYNDTILDVVGSENPEIARRIRDVNIDALINEHNQNMQKVRQNDIIEPMLMAVGTLSKEDLSEMAESLIYLTYLKRRFTFAEESVGGPVDVAVISKGDGFIWMKRKHYFKPDLNAQFFNNYFSFK
jgi:hypothetical protein